MQRSLSKSMLLAVLIVAALARPGWTQNLSNYTLAQQNEFLELYVQEETAEFAVRERQSGALWFSGPDNLNQERIKRGNARNVMRSLIVLNYFTPKREGKSLSSFVDSVQNEEFTVTMGPDVVRFDFTLGKQWPESAQYPIFVAQQKFEDLLERIEDPFDRDLLRESYSLLSFVKRPEYPYEKISIFGLDLADFFGNYEIELLSGALLQKKLGLRDEPYERVKYYLERLADTMVTFRADLERRGLLTARDFEFVFNGPFYALLDDTYALYNRPEFARIFADLGYTPSDVGEDHRLHSLDAPLPNPQVFKVSVLVSLDGPDLVVTVPVDQLSFPVDIPDDQGVLETFYPYSIDLLPYFGAAHQSVEGYLFVPERSGALIQISNPKKNSLPAYSGSVYGVDRAIAPQIEQIARGPRIYLPVFGLIADQRAFFTIIEQGASLAYINAESGGRSESFAKVYGRFALTPRASITLFGVETSQDDKMVDAYALEPYQGPITERITFLTGERAGYVGMAEYYRDYLVGRYGLEKIPTGSGMPLVAELIGGIHDFEPSFGAPRQVLRAMTSYNQAAQIIDDLTERGVSDLRLRYLGWSKGGIEHCYPERVQPEKALGSVADFERLLAYGRRPGLELYLDLDFNAVYRDRLFDRFRPGRDAARYLNRTAVKIWDYNPATFQRVLSRAAYVVSPRALPGLLDRFLADFARYPEVHLAVRRLGDDLYSDFVDKRDQMVHRPAAQDIFQGELEKIGADQRLLLLTGGNAYALPYAAQVVEGPGAASPLLIIDQNIPFFQLVLHGYVDYAGDPVNVQGFTQENLLRCLERGELPFFRWSYADSALIKGTDFEHLLATNYADSIEPALVLYKEAKHTLQKVRGQTMLDHEQVESGVFRTKFENGLEILVNYGDAAVTVGDVEICAGGYAVLERGTR